MKINIGVSNRHIHLCEKDYKELFGDTLFSVKNYLSQEGEFSSNLTLDIMTSKGVIKNVRVVGPLRSNTQVEVLMRDAYTLGINPPVSLSGDLSNSEEVTLVGPKGIVNTKSCIVANRHIHMNSIEASKLKLKDGDTVSVKIDSVRGGILDNVIIRVKDNYKLELHIDRDEADAFLVTNKSVGEIYGRERV